MTTTHPEWQYNELHHAGTDYESQAEVRAYDERMALIRDPDAEAREVLDYLEPAPGSTLVDFGAGTGAIALRAAARCGRVVAVDISQPMLDFTAEKARAAGLSNIEFVRAGFLTYEHVGEPARCAVSQIALHHLPDFWKQVALRRIAALLPPEGRFFLRDVVFSLPLERYEKSLDYAVKEIAEKGGESFRVSFARHIRAEYSTFDWIMEEMLYRAGFDLEDAIYGDHFIAAYKCVKRKGA
ncbi:MAG: class I SAM-dependent methyltransferase [Spirochaetes bacterium]|nr:class I SAM-dependent methyltransferase [Spirochaetota bacterium]